MHSDRNLSTLRVYTNTFQKQIRFNAAFSQEIYPLWWLDKNSDVEALLLRYELKRLLRDKELLKEFF
jgi:hypothetical protein